METLHTERDVRRYVVKRLDAEGWHIAEVQEAIWQDRWGGCGSALLESVGDRREDLIEDLVIDIERDLRVFSACDGWGAEAPRRGEDGGAASVAARAVPVAGIAPDPYEDDRARAFAEGLAGVAADDPGVRRFRDDALGGGVLAPEAARAFVASPLACLVSRGTVWRRSLPMPGAAIASRAEPAACEDDDRERIVVVVEPPGEPITVYRRRGGQGAALPLPDGDPVGYRSGSLVAELHKVAKRLSRSIPLWDDAEAAWFVLTGRPPVLPPLRGETRYVRGALGQWERAVVTLHVEPWVSEKRVAALYRFAQRNIDQSPIPRRDASLPAWLFKREEERAAGHVLSFEELRRRWNDAHFTRTYPNRPGWWKAVRGGEKHAAAILRPGYLSPSARRARQASVDSTPIRTPDSADDDG